MSKGFASNYRVAVLTGLVLVSFCGIGARLVDLHVVDRDKFLVSVEKARRELIPAYARRGDILDANGVLLATSRSVVELGVDPWWTHPEDRKKWPELARLIGRPLSEVETLFTPRYRMPAAVKTPAAPAASFAFGFHLTETAEVTPPEQTAPDDPDTATDEDDGHGHRRICWATLCDDLPVSVYDQVMKLGITGVYGRREYRRAYPHNDLAAHIIGYVNHDNVPMAGIERYANFYLRGVNGWVESEKDAHAHEMAQFRSREVPPADGYNVVLSLDATIQQMATAELATIVQKFQPLKATIIISDPRTGFILALANTPSFDLNNYNKLGKEDQGRMTDTALADVYEPGSVFKIVPASGALNDGVVTPGTLFDCSLDKIDYKGRSRNLPKEDASDRPFLAHPVPVTVIIARSSNRGAAQLAMCLGDERFYQYVRAFGFGQKTGFPDLGGESRGILAPPSKWDGLTITRMPMGQSIGATPLQTHVAMSVIASGGVRLRPQIIREIRDANNQVVYRFGRVEIQRVISEGTARTMAQMLEGVVSENGTAKGLEIPGFEIAAKTGTAQKVLPGGHGYAEHHYVSSFVGFFPASDPRVDISVIVDDAKMPGVAFGAKVAGPSFRRLALELIPYLDIRQPMSGFAPSDVAMEGGRR